MRDFHSACEVFDRLHLSSGLLCDDNFYEYSKWLYEVQKKKEDSRFDKGKSREKKLT